MHFRLTCSGIQAEIPIKRFETVGLNLFFFTTILSIIFSE